MNLSVFYAVTPNVRFIHGSFQGQTTVRKEGRKEMFYLTTHSTHFIYGYMVKDHSGSERG